MTADDHDDESLGSNDRRENETEEEAKTRKRKERLEQNRISARESRKRKKTMIEELQRTVITLSRENKDLNERNETLRRNLMEIGSKYPNIVPLQAIVGQGAAQAPTQSDPPAATGGGASSASTANTTGVPAPTADPVAPTTTGAAPSAVASPGGFASFNPMAWLSAPNAAGATAPDSANQANV